MEPFLGRTIFNIEVFLILLNILVMPFLEKGTVEYIINLIALCMNLLFLYVIINKIRKEVKTSIIGVKKHKYNKQLEGK